MEFDVDDSVVHWSSTSSWADFDLIGLLNICFHIDLLSIFVGDVSVLFESLFHWENNSSASISIPSRDNVRFRFVDISVLITDGDETVRISGLEEFCDFEVNESF